MTDKLKYWPYALAVLCVLIMAAGYFSPAFFLTMLPGTSFVFGAVAPWRAWRWPLVFSGVLALVQLLALLAKADLPFKLTPADVPMTTLVIFLISLVATYLGVLLRWAGENLGRRRA